jgi:hypothetical protein
MKKFITKLIQFSALPFFMLLCFEIYLRNIDTLYTEKYNGLMNIKQEVEVLFLGNSHANYGINPLYIKDFKAYNLANVNQQIYFDKRLTIKAINDGLSNLKYVFISVDYHSLFTSSQGIRNVWSFYANGIKYKNQDYTREQISAFIWGYTPKISFSLLKKDITRILKYGNSVIHFDVEDGVNINDTLYNGYIGFEGINNQSFNNNIYRERAIFFKENQNNSERIEVIEDLTSFISFLKNRNIEPILFSSPTYKEYNEYLDKEQINRNIKDINKICKDFKIEYWRFDEDPRFSKEDFYNQDHLNNKGAEKFSKIINDKLKVYDKEYMHNKVYIQ